MNKTIRLGLAAILTTTVLSTGLGIEQVKADEAEDDEEKDQVDDFLPEVEEVSSLTLDEAIDFGLNSDFSLMDLDYQLKNLESAKGGTEYEQEEIEDDIEDLKDEREELKRIQRELGESTFQERKALFDQEEELEDTIEELDDTIEELKSNNVVLKYNKEEAEEGIKQSIISTYTTLQMDQEQIDFQKQTLKTKKQEVHNLKRKYQIGAASRSDYESEKRELSSLESELEQSKQELIGDKAVFALNIGVKYHSHLTLENLDLDELELVEQEKETEELIEDSYDMKTAKEELELARYDRDQVYDDDDANRYDREQEDLNVETKLLNIAELKSDAKRDIKELYSDVKQQYQKINDAEKEITYEEEDYEDMKRRYEIGVLSKADYEQAHASIEQATFEHKMEKYNYYLLLNQVEDLESGILPTESGGMGDMDGMDK